MKELNMITGLGWFLIRIGIVLIVVGIFARIIGKLLPEFQLPGDILIKGENFTFYFPLATSIVLSILVTLVLTLFYRK